MPAATRYTAQQGAIVGRNLPHFANRPLYVNNSDLYIAAGDRPLIRLIKRRRVLGAFELCAETDSGPLSLQEFADITLRYRAGHITWELRDARFAGVITLEAGAPEGQDAALLRLSASQPLALTWRYGGQALVPGGPFSLDPFSEPGWLDRPFDESLCAGSRAALAGGGFTLANAALWPAEEERVIAGWCSQVDYAVLGGDAPYISGSIQAVPGEDILWGLYLRPAAAPGGPAPDLAAGWQSVLARSASLSSRVVTQTPDQELDTLMGPVAAEIDGAWYPPLTMHSTVSWNVPFLGWCNRFGNTLGGWHERILAEVAYYAPLQVRDDSKRAMTADPARKLTVAAPDSRFYGRGYMPPHTYFYNMQSQFIDQAIHAWRATGGAALQALLRPMLELHCEWVDECFDPDQDGIYESYINTWPTDSVWYNGGGSVEETCYALRAHQAAAELAEAAGDAAGAERHNRVIERIRRGFFALLWIAKKGHPGKYREQGGHRRLHENPWLYGVFQPIDAGLLDAEQAAQTLHYSQWALENTRLPYGGRKVWMSNWVPSIWSVRECGPGENLQLAYAFFRAGLPDEGYDVLRGTLLSTGYDALSPGRITSELGSLYYRAVIEGLFGYLPDYPRGRVRLTPQFPPAWDEASITTPDISLRYKRSGSEITFAYRLARAARVEIELPADAGRVLAVQGASAWAVEPGFGRQVVRIDAGEGVEGRVVLETARPFVPLEPVMLKAEPLGQLTIRSRGRITALRDPQGITTSITLADGAAEVRLAEVSGHHMLFADVEVEGAAVRQLIYLELSATRAELAYRARLRPQIPAQPRWCTLDISPALNGDIRTIYRQQYLSPRPATISARIGSDGYSPWTFTFWGNEAPEIGLENIPVLLGANRELVSPSGVPFRWPAGERNIAFTSLWDNWPARVTMPVGRSGRAAWLHLCGTTNPMQCGIANAVVLFTYADGAVERLELVNPDNFWSLCPLYAQSSAAGQGSHTDYSYEFDSFCLPAQPPETMQLGTNCRSIIAGWALRPDVPLATVTLEALSQEVVIGLMGVTLLE